MKRSVAPIFWLMFGAGGIISTPPRLFGFPRLRFVKLQAQIVGVRFCGIAAQFSVGLQLTVLAQRFDSLSRNLRVLGGQ